MIYQGRFAVCAMLALAIHSAHAADYTYSSSTTSNWGDGSRWTTSGVDDSTFPDDVLDNVIGNSQVTATLVNGNFTIGDFQATTTGWTVRSTTTTSVSLGIDELTNITGVTMNFTSQTGGGLSLTVRQATVNGGTLVLGGIANSTATQGLSALTVSDGVSLATGTVNVHVTSDYNLGLLTTSLSGNKTISLTNSSSTGMTRTATVTGISSAAGAGVLTIRTTGIASTGDHAATLRIDNGIDYSTNAVIVNGNGSANAGNTIALVKEGIGTQTLTGASTYTGGTTISGGTVLANNTTGSALGAGSIGVAIGGTLGGTGSVAGATTVSGAIAPGSTGIEDLEIANDVTWNSGVDWKFELGTANASDRLNITGAGDFLKGSGSGSSWRFDFQNLGAAGNTYTLVDWAGSTDFTAENFSHINLPIGLSGTFAINGSQLDFTVVPEPATWSLVGVSLAPLLTLRRRRG